jgi:hypothetical protein
LDFYVDANFPKIIEKNPIEDELLQLFCKKGCFTLRPNVIAHFMVGKVQEACA